MPLSPPVQPKVSGPKSIIDVSPRLRGFAERWGSANSLLMALLVPRLASRSVQQAAGALFGLGLGLARRKRFGIRRRRCMVADHAPAAARVGVEVGGDDRAGRTALAHEGDVFVNAVHREQPAADLLQAAQLEAHGRAAAKDLPE